MRVQKSGHLFWFGATACLLALTALLAEAASFDIRHVSQTRQLARSVEIRLIEKSASSEVVQGVSRLEALARRLEECLIEPRQASSACRTEAVEVIHEFDGWKKRIGVVARQDRKLKEDSARLSEVIEKLRKKVDGPWNFHLVEVDVGMDGRKFHFSGRFKVEILTSCIREVRERGISSVNALTINGETTQIFSSLAVNQACRLVTEAAG